MTVNRTMGGTRRGNGWRMLAWGSAVFLFLLPLVAMQFTAEVDWTAGDFTIWGFMLLVACGTYELGTRLSNHTAYRAAFGIVAVAGFFLVWINLAVGIIGNEGNPANLLFGGVLLIGFVGALVARFRAHGMARTLTAMAITQALVGIVALVERSPEGAILTLLFAAAWLLAAALFRRAGQAQERAGWVQ